MSDLLRVGIVGSKFAAAFHFESYHSAGALATVAGVYSKTRENTDKFAAARGITAFSSFEEMVESVDVVDICAPGYVHEQYAIKAAQRPASISSSKNPTRATTGPMMPAMTGAVTRRASRPCWKQPWPASNESMLPS